MSGYKLKIGIMLLAMLISFAAPTAMASYWFQSGAVGGQQTQYNQGASALIETVSTQPPAIGSLGYWIGETLSNGAFLQVGYEIPNQTGSYPQNCNPSGCNGTVSLTAGQPVWFWEYFPAGSGSGSFYGGIGPEGSVGTTGTFNQYSFNSSTGIWGFYVNGKMIGSENLYSSYSGPSGVLAVAEYADAPDTNYQMPLVQFKDLSFFNRQGYEIVPVAYSLIGYGSGSAKTLPNTYGVKEIDNATDYFEVGSGLPLVNALQLWKGGAHLGVQSEYPISGAQSGNYLLNTQENLTAPQTVQVGNGTRAYFVGWTGKGAGSYTGNSPTALVYMYSNITETANWNVQYFVNVSSEYFAVIGSGWYDSGSSAKLSLVSNTIHTGIGQRAVFVGWSTGGINNNLTFTVSSPMQVNVTWQPQYYVNATSQYSKVNGDGWYAANSLAVITLINSTVYQTPSARLGFYDWNNGSTDASFSTIVTAPVHINAVYEQQYLVNLQAQNSYGGPINADYFELDGVSYSPNSFLFANHPYVVSYAKYKGVRLGTNTTVNVTAPQTAYVKLPVFNITIRTTGILGASLNASYSIYFRNGTGASGYMGSNGTVSFDNVPFGYAYGSVQFYNQNRTLLASNGNKVTVVLLDPNTLFYGFAPAVVLILVGLELRNIRRKHKKVKR